MDEFAPTTRAKIAAMIQSAAPTYLAECVVPGQVYARASYLMQAFSEIEEFVLLRNLDARAAKINFAAGGVTVYQTGQDCRDEALIHMTEEILTRSLQICQICGEPGAVDNREMETLVDGREVTWFATWCSCAAHNELMQTGTLEQIEAERILCAQRIWETLVASRGAKC